MPVVIQAEDPAELLSYKKSGEPSERTKRIQQLEEYADAVIAAVKEKGGALVDFSDSEFQPAQFVSGLRSALYRAGHDDILVEKRRNTTVVRAWKIRPEDEPRLEQRRERGAALGAAARARTAPAAPRGATRARAQTAVTPEPRGGKGRRARSA